MKRNFLATALLALGFVGLLTAPAAAWGDGLLGCCLPGHSLSRYMNVQVSMPYNAFTPFCGGFTYNYGGACCGPMCGPRCGPMQGCGYPMPYGGYNPYMAQGYGYGYGMPYCQPVCPQSCFPPCPPSCPPCLPAAPMNPCSYYPAGQTPMFQPAGFYSMNPAGY